MVFAVQCPNPKCKKFMLVEGHQQGKVVSCLICRTSIKVGAAPNTSSKPTPLPKS
jgi:hypothetical protein